MDRKLPSEIIISDGSFLLRHKKNVYVKPKADRVTLDVDELMIPASPGVGPAKPSGDPDFLDEEWEEDTDNEEQLFL